MSDALRVLLLEDVDDDAVLVERELRRTHPTCEIRRVDSRTGFAGALETFAPQLILSDHRLAGFSGMDALDIVRETTPDTPFIFVTGSLSEETAVECIKAGAWDYVLKDRLIRLGPAVHGVLELRRTREELRRSQEQLLQAQKMDALGRLAGGVAHDYNNLSTAILGYCDLLAPEFDTADPRLADLLEIRRAAERGAGLTQQLLAFSRKQVIRFQPLQLNDVVHRSERLLRRLLGENIELASRLDGQPDWIHSDPGQCEQVVINLAINARDAMPDGGRLTIETATVTLDDTYVAQHAHARSGVHVQLAVADTGVGMDAQTVARVFEPFFTTKARGKGTGLGLATVYGIVRQSGGHITIESEPGRGTVFHVFFPATEAPLARSASESGPAVGVLTGNETILLTEDDAAVRTLARRVLEAHGYTVHEAASALEAIALVATKPETLHLLVTDIVLPEMSGIELARQLVRQRPGLRVMCMSGYSGDELPAHEVPAGWSFLQKPFTPESIARRVRVALDAPAA